VRHVNIRGRLRQKNYFLSRDFLSIVTGIPPDRRTPYTARSYGDGGDSQENRGAAGAKTPQVRNSIRHKDLRRDFALPPHHLLTTSVNIL
jgi:hypothetical protein